jgi:DNA replication and repair protein RecF
VHIGGVEVTDFRNFRDLSFTPTSRLNLLCGSNAQGKTNVLEALAVLMVGRSFRGARAADLTRWGCPRATVEGELCRQELSRDIRRVVEQHGNRVWTVAGEGCAWARVIAFGWQDLAMVTGAPQARREFLDGFTARLYPAHLPAYRRYRRILERRNHLLQTLAGAALGSALGPWNEQLARAGMELVARRRTAQRALEREVADLYPVLAGRGEVTLRYRSSLGEEPTEARFCAALEDAAAEEARRGLTLVGPHRDDLLIELDGREMRSFGSRGQQRLMALTLRLAEVSPVAEAVGSTPVLLLDDALSELDARAQGRVVERVTRAGQVFLTSAGAALEEVQEATWWRVENGRVRQSEHAELRGAA